MNTLKSFSSRHPVWFVTMLTITWLIVLLAVTGAAAIVLQRPFGDAVSATIGRLIITTLVLLLGLRLGWLKAAGILSPGRWSTWLFAIGGMVYFTIAALYAYFGRVAFDFSTLIKLPSGPGIVLTQFVVSICEEILFRGIVLYSLVRVWGNTARGLIASVGLTAVIFAALHLMNIFALGTPPASALLLTLEGCIIAIWWGALVIHAKSIWPAVVLHFVGNAVLPLQNLSMPMIEPEILSITRILGFSIPLGLLALLLLAKSTARTDLSANP